MSFQALTDRKLRSSLTILMVVIGVALIIAVNGLSAGIKVYINNEFEGLGPNLLVVTVSSSAFGGYGTGGEDGAVTLTDSEVAEIANIDGVKYAVPYFQATVKLSGTNGEKYTPVFGIDTTKLPLIFPRYGIAKGDYLALTDHYGILLGSQLANLEEDPFADLGDIIKITYQQISGSITFQNIEEKSKSFTVRGIGKEMGLSSSSLPFDRAACISVSAANLLLDRNSEYDGICVLTEDPSLNEQVEDALKEGYSDYNLISPTAIAETFNTINGAVGGFITSIAIVSLCVASIGIITTLWTSMMERIKEIGTLKALGYTKRQILILFLNEALIIGALGGIIGLIAGVGAGNFLTAYIDMIFPFGGSSKLGAIFEPTTLLMVWLGAVIVSAISGFYPAKKAADLDPVTALRKE
ncbi:MAG: ABC transporter permease [Candidatus Hermodarchaeota archaeon]